jgi:hypothetical protein
MAYGCWNVSVIPEKSGVIKEKKKVMSISNLL